MGGNRLPELLPISSAAEETLDVPGLDLAKRSSADDPRLLGLADNKGMGGIRLPELLPISSAAEEALNVPGLDLAKRGGEVRGRPLAPGEKAVDAPLKPAANRRAEAGVGG